MSPPPAHSISPKGDDEVESKKTFPGRGETPRPPDIRGKKSPRGLVTGPEFPLGLSRIPFRRSTWLRGLANSIPLKEGMCLFHR